MGATVGKIFGMAGAMKSGIGTASFAVQGGVIGALVAVNSLGDVIDPEDGSIVAGARPARLGPLRLGGRGPFVDTQAWMGGRAGQTILRLASRANTVIGVVATDAWLTKEQANWVAQAAHDGIARTVRPAHTLLDGDTLFALSTGRRRIDVNVVGAFAAEAVARAVVRAVRAAHGVGRLPAARDMERAGSRSAREA
jgi:L-aminopeptidase/D-esterase-like protein